MKDYYVYILTNDSGASLYTGFTNDLARRVYEHKNNVLPGFTSRYKINRLVYYESTPDVKAAIRREKEIKGWVRKKKIALIQGMNPYWMDFSETFA